MVAVLYSIIFLHSITYLVKFTNKSSLKGLARMLESIYGKIVAYHDNLIYLTLVDIPLYSSIYLELIIGLRRILIPF